MYCSRGSSCSAIKTHILGVRAKCRQHSKRKRRMQSLSLCPSHPFVIVPKPSCNQQSNSFLLSEHPVQSMLFGRVAFKKGTIELASEK